MGIFDGQVAMITGAGGGLAAGVIPKYAAEGAKLVLIDRDQQRLKERAQEFGLTDYLCTGGDLGDPEQVDAIVKQAESTYGTIDMLVHVAGGFAMGDPVHDAGLDVYEKMMFLNAQLTWVTCGRVAKHMIEKGVAGRMVVTLARSALRGGTKNGAAYAASKAAAQRIIESMALELHEHNIRINGVMPSIIDTAPNRDAMPNADFSKWVTPEQIADAMIFLTSDASSSISGDSLAVYHKA